MSDFWPRRSDSCVSVPPALSAIVKRAFSPVARLASTSLPATLTAYTGEPAVVLIVETASSSEAPAASGIVVGTSAPCASLTVKVRFVPAAGGAYVYVRWVEDARRVTAMSYPPGPAPPVRVTATFVASLDVTDWVSAHVPVERSAVAASCSALSCVVTWLRPSRRACSCAWRISMRVRGWRSTAMSESMMEAVSRPEARPLSWMPAIVLPSYAAVSGPLWPMPIASRSVSGRRTLPSRSQRLATTRPPSWVYRTCRPSSWSSS